LEHAFRLGIDAGGTFTDFIIANRASGEVKLFKALSTPSDPTRAIENGLKLIADDLGLPASQVVSDCDLCINGTTVGLNALITHRGGKTGLICTAGHEDSIEIRNGHKEDGYRYDPEYPAATMLVPRYLRRGIRERVISDGSIRTPMNEEDVREACRIFLKEDVETVAISFVWSVLNPAHERRAAEIVREMMPHVILTVGSELYPQIREYTRTSTAVTNAYLAPVMRRYVTAVDAYFRKLGAKQPVRYFQSNGGLAIGKAMTDRSVYAINSGPASAPQAGLYVCAPFGKDNVITVDMGGTSFDITLTRNGQTNLNKNIDFLRYRIGVPMIQVETLGAGGGSIGWIDVSPASVGPQSAGSEPGPPATARRHGADDVRRQSRPGLSQPRRPAGRALPVDMARARQAVAKVAEPLGISIEQPPTACSPSSTATWSTASAGLGRARLRPARLRAGRRRRRDRRPHHRPCPRDGHRHRHPAQARFRALRVRPGHLRREIQLHGHGAAAAGQRRRLREGRQPVRGDRGAGHRASGSRRLPPEPDRRQAQPGDALCRPGARMHGGHRHVQDHAADHRQDQGRVPRPARGALHLFGAPQRRRGGQHRIHHLRPHRKAKGAEAGR